MTVTLHDERVLEDVLGEIDIAAVQGDVSPRQVIDVIDHICRDLGLLVDQLPETLWILRCDAYDRILDGEGAYAEPCVGDLIVTCGLWDD